MKLVFEWDAQKAKDNSNKHKISFNEAKTIFSDPYLLTYFDEFHSDNEERYISIGYSARNRILLAVYIEHQSTKETLMIRVISCRKATPAERKNYEAQ